MSKQKYTLLPGVRSTLFGAHKGQGVGLYNLGAIWSCLEVYHKWYIYDFLKEIGPVSNLALTHTCTCINTFYSMFKFKLSGFLFLHWFSRDDHRSM